MWRTTQERKAKRRQGLPLPEGATLSVSLLFFLWLLWKPASPFVFKAVVDLFEIVGPLLAAVLCLTMVGRAPRSRQRLAAACLGLGVLSFSAGQTVWAWYEIVLRHDCPFPSWSDACFLLSYPLLLAGILCMPRAPLPSVLRGRVLLDGLMVMTGVVTFSWYFVLGPTLMQGSETLLGKILGMAYPLSDIVLLFCLLVLAAREEAGLMCRETALLWLGMLCIVAVDTIFAYKTLHNTYHIGGLMDVGWVVGYMLVGAAGCALVRFRSGKAAQETAPSLRAPILGRSLAPYILVPAVGVLVCWTVVRRGDAHLAGGVWIGSALLLALLLTRQVLAILENSQLYRRLQEAYRSLHDANERLEGLATTDPLTGLPNHRAMVTTLDLEMERVARFHRPCAILFLDIDHFKALNDTLGHGAGDAVLIEFGDVVRGALRGIDQPGRWGGEEFIALLPETDREAALRLAEAVREAVASHSFRAFGGHLTCSVGVALCPDDAGSRSALMEAADGAMYAAKRLGRNQVRSAADPAVTALNASDSLGSRAEETLRGEADALALLVAARDRYTGQHNDLVAALSVRLALALGQDAQAARLVGLVGQLHDIGKVAIPDAVLHKPGRLNEEEWKQMHEHPVVGADVVRRMPSLRMIAPSVRSHHERWDGSGYPDSLAGERIPLAARIVAVADAYGAMTTDRPYRQASSHGWVMAELRRCAGRQFDPTVVEALVRVLGDASEQEATGDDPLLRAS